MSLIEIDLHPDARTLRQFGFIALLGFGALAAAAWFEMLVFRSGLGAARVPVALALAGLGAFAAACSLVAPRANRPLYVGLICISFPIGWLVSNAALALLFFCVFAPIGWCLRRAGHDPLERSRGAEQTSYWSDVRSSRQASGYFKQF